MDIEQNAPVIAREEIMIAAPLETVWKLHTDINNWAQWNKDIDSAQLDADALAVGKSFSWTTAGMTIVSTVGEIAPRGRIAWSGDASGIFGVHVWKFMRVEGGAIVQTEESWRGAAVNKADEQQKALAKSLRAWLESLKREAESR